MSDHENEYQRRLGERLRAIRTQQGLTLQQVEELSGGDWKAVVVGSYERADRSISMAKLARLASFYGVPVSEFLPDPVADDPDLDLERPRVAIDLTALSGTGDLSPIDRYTRTIALQRGDYNGRVLTLREADLRALAVLYGLSVEDLIERLSDQGVVAHAA